MPPPPPPPGKLGGPPPPPPKFGAAKAGGAKKDERQFFNGPAPSKKMKPFHWEKQGLPEESGSIWHRIHDAKEFDLKFDYEEFESMYSQKEVVAEEKPKEVKKKKVILVDEKTFQNLSIMLHKLPTISNIQRAITELDDETLSRDSLVAIVAQIPAPDVVKKFTSMQDSKPLEEYEPPEQFVALTLTLPAFRLRCMTWLFTKEYEDNVSGVIKPIIRLTCAIDSVLASKHLPYILGLLLMFGNMMNYGNGMKGNAAAIPISTISKLDATKDNRGKISLMQHLFNTMRKENPDSFDVAEELKPIMNNVHQIKFEELEKGVTDSDRQLKQFSTQVATVKKQLEKAGVDLSEEAYLPRMVEFQTRAEARLNEATEEFEKCKSSFEKLLVYFGATKKPFKPEDIFGELVPFVERVKKEAAEAAKDKKRQLKKGKKVGDELTDVVGKLQESMVQA